MAKEAWRCSGPSPRAPESPGLEGGWPSETGHAVPDQPPQRLWGPLTLGPRNPHPGLWFASLRTGSRGSRKALLGALRGHPHLQRCALRPACGLPQSPGGVSPEKEPGGKGGPASPLTFELELKLGQWGWPSREQSGGEGKAEREDRWREFLGCTCSSQDPPCPRPTRQVRLLGREESALADLRGQVRGRGEAALGAL